MLGIIVALLILGLLLLFFEAFLPFGITGTFGALLILLSAILCIREYGWTAGLYYLAGSAILAISVSVATFYGISHRLALRPTGPGSHTGDMENYQLIGKRGVVTRTLSPTGYATIRAKRYSVRSETSHTLIPRGKIVVVTGVDGHYLLVVESDETPLSSPSEA